MHSDEVGFVNIKADTQNPFWVNLARIEAIGVGARHPLVHIVGWDDTIEATRWTSAQEMMDDLKGVLHASD